MEGNVETITVREVAKKSPWNKPGSTQWYYTIVTEDHSSEPVKFIGDTAREIAKPEPGITYLGKLYGDKFYPAKIVEKDSETPHSGPKAELIGNAAPKKEWQPRDDDAIRAQWSIGQAMSHFAAKDEVKLRDVETLANALFEMVDRVKSPKVEAPSITQSVEEAQAQREAERDQAEFKQRLMDTVYEPGEDPINLSDIPFGE